MNNYDIAIIGAGPAGLSAGIYSARAGKKTCIFEKLIIGGQAALSYEILNYPGFLKIDGYELTEKMKEQALKNGCEIQSKNIIKIEKYKTLFKLYTDNCEIITKKVILSMGASPRKLNLANEQKFIGKGVSYCATCDGALFRGKNVAVIGGGDTAFEDMLYLAEFANKVYSIHRSAEYKANYSLIQKVQSLTKSRKIELIINDEVSELVGETVLSKINLKSGKSISVDGVFVAIGRKPDTENVIDFVTLNNSGYVIVNSKMETNIDGVFACGDVTEKELRQVVTACNDGALAATNAVK